MTTARRVRERATVALFGVVAAGSGCGPTPVAIEAPSPPLGPIAPLGRDAPPSERPGPLPLAAPFAVGQVWSGTYTCPQGATEARLRLEGGEGVRLVGTFEFHHRPSGKKGSFGVVGGFDPGTSRLAFAPVQWIDRPSRYVTIGLDGELEEDVFKGFVTNRECGAFELRRER